MKKTTFIVERINESEALSDGFEDFRSAEIAFCREINRSADVALCVETPGESGLPADIKVEKLAAAIDGQVVFTADNIVSFKVPVVVEEGV